MGAGQRTRGLPSIPLLGDLPHWDCNALHISSLSILVPQWVEAQMHRLHVRADAPTSQGQPLFSG